MYDRRTFGKLAGAAGVQLALAGAASRVATSRKAEAAALVKFAEDTHPRGAEAKLNSGWRALAARFTGSADALSYAAYVAAAYRQLAWFKDGHTTLWAGELDQGPFALRLPLRAAPFFDGLYIVEADAANRDLIGARITRIGSLEVNALISRFAGIWPADNPAWTHHDLGLLLATPGFLHGLGAIAGPDAAPVRVESLSSNGAAISKMLVPSRQPPTREPIERPTSRREKWAADAKSGNYVHRIPDNQTLYLSLDDLSVELMSFVAFLRQVFTAMAEPKWSRLVVDLRRNGGGNNYLGEPLRREVARSRFNRPGGLYVLTGPSTFSAAQNLVNRLERETFAIFAGEPAGGSPRHFGDAKPFEAGAITLRGGVSTLPWFDSYPQDQRKWVMPDLLIPRTFADWRAGRDLVLDAVLEHDTSGPADELQEDRVLYFRRKSQSAEWKPFWLQ